MRLGRREGGEGRKAGERERERAGGGRWKSRAAAGQGRAGEQSSRGREGVEDGLGKKGREKRWWHPVTTVGEASTQVAASSLSLTSVSVGWASSPPSLPLALSPSLSPNSNPSHLKTKDRMSRSSSLNELTPSPECFVTNSFLVVFTTEISSIRQNVSKENQALHRHHHPLEARRNSMQFSFFFCVSEPRVRDEYTSCSSENI